MTAAEALELVKRHAPSVISCDECTKLRRKFGHDGRETYCPEFKRLADQYEALERDERAVAA